MFYASKAIDREKQFYTFYSSLSKAKHHSDSSLSKAKHYSDSSLSKAKHYSDSQLSKAKHYSDSSLSKAKHYSFLRCQRREFKTKKNIYVSYKSKRKRQLGVISLYCLFPSIFLFFLFISYFEFYSNIIFITAIFQKKFSLNLTNNSIQKKASNQVYYKATDL